jgi:hypothetical protein
MKTLTPQQIVDLNPCEGYNLEQVTELFDNKKSVTYLEILNTDKIPLENIIWVFCQPGILNKDVSDQWTEIIITRAVKNHALHCGIEKVEQWATNWLSGVDRTAKAARYAHSAAGYAARAAADYTANAGYAAGYAAHAAAGYAAYAAIYAAYSTGADYTAIYSTIYSTYAAAVHETEHKQQIEDLKNIL